MAMRVDQSGHDHIALRIDFLVGGMGDLPDGSKIFPPSTSMSPFKISRFAFWVTMYAFLISVVIRIELAIRSEIDNPCWGSETRHHPKDSSNRKR